MPSLALTRPLLAFFALLALPTVAIAQKPPLGAETKEQQDFETLDEEFQKTLSLPFVEIPQVEAESIKPPRLRTPTLSTEQLSQMPHVSSLPLTPSQESPLEKAKTLGIQALSVSYQQHITFEAYLNFFTGRGRSHMRRCLERYPRYAATIERIFAEEQVPADLFLGVAIIESGLNPRAYSYAHASGIWQFIPSTGTAYGMQINKWIDERRDIEKSTRAAARLLKDLYKQFGSWELAFAAYNAGGGTVLSQTRKYNTNNFWAIADAGGWPEQTRFYVPKALAAALIFKNPAAFGFYDIKTEDPWKYDLVHLPLGQVSLKTLANAANIDLAVLRDYNPELLQEFTPPDRAEYLLRLPEGKGAAFQESLSKIWSKDRLTFGRYFVRQGQLLEEIASDFGISTYNLASLNGLSPTEGLFGGQVLLVPMPFGEEAPSPEKTTEDIGAISVMFSGEFSYVDRRLAYYRVRKRDTLDNLAKAFEVDAQDIALWNQLDPKANLISGLILRVYVKDGFDPSRAILLNPDRVKALMRLQGQTQGSKMPEGGVVGQSSIAKTTTPEKSTEKETPKEKFYYVKKGDSLSSISTKLGVSLVKLQKANNLTAKSALKIGQRLLIPR